MSSSFITKQAAYVSNVLVLSVSESVKRDDPEDDYSECEMSAVERNTLIGQVLTLTSVFNMYELICNPC